MIDKTLTILGTGQTLDAGGRSRVLEIDGPQTTVILSRLTVTGGLAGLVSAPSPAYAGGGIAVNDATLAIRNSVITRNQAVGNASAAVEAEGAGLFAIESDVSLTNTSVIGNRSLGSDDSLAEQAGPGGGGGIFLVASQATIIGGRIQANVAQGGNAVNPITEFPSSNGGAGDGGGVLLLGSNLALARVNISGNRAIGGQGLDGSLAPQESTAGPGIGGTAAGGAIFTEAAAPGSTTSTLSIKNSFLKNNLAQGGPGGMAVSNGSQSAVPGGQALGGAIEQQDETTLVLSRDQILGNAARGGLAAPNSPESGDDTSSGGEAFGGAIDSEFFTAISASGVTFRGNRAQGEQGGNSAPNIGTDAGQGGPAQGGAWNLRDTGGITIPAALPVVLTNTTFANNQALAGPGGAGPQRADGEPIGAYATGGGMQSNGIFNLTMTGTRWLNNKAVAQQGEFAFGGALGMSYGYKTGQTTITRSLFRGNRVRGGDDPQSPSLRVAEGGAILNNNPNTTIAGTTFVNNVAQAGNATGIGVPGNAEGGAIDSTGPNSTLNLTSDRLIGNRALGGLVVAGPQSTDPESGLAEGGAFIVNDAGALTASGDLFSANIAQTQGAGAVHDAFGGALYISADSTAQVARSSFRGNNARAQGGSSAFGGALASFGSAFADIGSTYGANQAIVQAGGAAYGGGLYLASDATLSKSKITRNTATARPRATGQGFGGGIAFASNPRVGLQNVVLRLNHASTAGDDLFGDHQST